MSDIDPNIEARRFAEWKAVERLERQRESRLFALSCKPVNENLAMVLECHLIVEHYMNAYLAKYRGLQEIEDLGLSFYQKVKLLPDSHQLVARVKGGIFELNRVRNKFAHQLDYELEAKDVEQMERCMHGMHPPGALTYLQSIQRFTQIACRFISEESPIIERWWDSLPLEGVEIGEWQRRFHLKSDES